MKKGFSDIEAKIMSLPTAKQTIGAWKKDGQKVVFTNGCFDLLHLGHIHYLADAAALGNRLVIGLNTDQSVRILKGENRPVNDENSRAAMLAALEFTDAIILFPEDTPREMIATLLPDVLVKGGDYTVEQIAGAKEVLENGGAVEVLDFVPGYSSSSIIRKIQNEK
ncbi:MAG: D-glycero-beta-D-manno-heptose 1-phosphate adenylyltransferase [Mucilaginibacter polytrichastri]|nr:D-glycero-beta-D-manno-heptose 1-phosphate adenylyltransferase [Mucilaginibacter polytrichastri]